MSQDFYKNIIYKWLSEFKSKLNNNKDSYSYSYEVYILNKDFLLFPEKRGNLNKNIINQEIIDYKNGRFFLLDDKAWVLVKSKYPNEIELKYKGSFIQNKYIIIINMHVYYFYFINENNNIEEGYFEFKKHKDSAMILALFYDFKIKDFFRKMKIKKTNEEQIINYKGIHFIIKIKENDNKNNIFQNYDKNKNINDVNNKSKIINDFNSNLIKYQNPLFKDRNNINLNNKINLPLELEKNEKKDINKSNKESILSNEIINNNKKNRNEKNNMDINNNKNSNFDHIINKNNNLNFSKTNNVQKVLYLSHANGLENLDANCYMNAILQCLAHIENLTKGFLKQENMQEILSKKSKFRLTNSYIEILKNLWLNNNIQYFSPINFKNLISEINPLFSGKKESKAKDFFLFLMEIIHNELNISKKDQLPNQNLNQYNYEETLKFFTTYFRNNYNSIISNLFYGMYNSMTTCLNCHKTSHNIQCYNILIFPLEQVKNYKNKIQNAIDIKDCFEYFEKDNKGIQIYCNICQRVAHSINSSKIIICPNILVVNLNRGKGIKSDINILFNEYLDLQNFIYYKESPSFYELIGIVTHLEEAKIKEKYIAFCKSFVDQNWYKYSDTQINKSSFQEASTTGFPYFLFYSFIKK